MCACVCVQMCMCVCECACVYAGVCADSKPCSIDIMQSGMCFV